MKIHFGMIENCGDYETPLNICEETLCGCSGEKVTENATNNWKFVTCKNCLKQKKKYKEACKAENEFIVKQMGEFVDFVREQEKLVWMYSAYLQS